MLNADWTAVEGAFDDQGAPRPVGAVGLGVELEFDVEVDVALVDVLAEVDADWIAV